MTPLGPDWRVVDGATTAWFEATSLRDAAALAQRCLQLAPNAAIDVRAGGARIRLDTADHTEAVSAAAGDLGLAANPTVLQQLSVVLESADPSAMRPFWQRALGFDDGPDGALMDPSRRDPTLHLRPSTDRRPLRHRVHLDVVRPAAAVAAAGLGEGSGPYDVRYADADGNEVDLVPGDALGDSVETADWQTVFGAMACYRAATPAVQSQVAIAAAAVAEAAGFPLRIDVRPGVVILDSGKDQWEADAHGLALDFHMLAADIQSAVRALGATADPALPRFVQLFIDAADVATLRTFWAAAIGSTPDRRAGVTDLHDPRGIDPVLVFQELDATDGERRRQRNRIHFELAVPADFAPTRVEAAVAAGGRLVDESAHRWLIIDPEGNELAIVAAP